jgi:hypothetical protein
MNRGVRPDRYHLSGDLEAERISHAGRRRIIALTLVDIGSIYPCGFDPDQNLALRRSRAWAHLNFQHLRTSRAGRNDGAHLFALVSHVIFPGDKPRVVNR